MFILKRHGRMTKLSKVLLLLPLCISLSLFSNFSFAKSSNLNIGVSQYPPTLHPLLDSSTAQSYIRGFAFRATSGYDHDWQVTCFYCEVIPSFENGLAEIIDRPKAKEGESAKGIKMRIKLKQDLFWADGKEMTTRDMAFWYRVATSDEVQGIVGLTTYKHIERVEIIDKHTLDVYVDRVSYSYNSTYIPNMLPAHIEEAIFNSNPKDYHQKSNYVTNPTQQGLYNGPYTITNLRQGQFIQMKRNPYWKGTQPYFETITIKTISDTQALQANLLSGDIDYISGEAGITLDQALQFEQKFGDRYIIDIKSAALYEHIDTNLDNIHLADIRVRQALMYGLNRELLVQKLFQGRLQVANSKVSPLDAIYDPTTPHYHYDPEKAKRLLKEAGYQLINGVQSKNGQSLELEFMTTAGNKTRELVQQFAQNQWKQIGVNVVINNQPARVYFGTTLNQRQHKALAMYAWSSSPEHLPRTTEHSQFIPTASNNWSGQNYPGYVNPVMDKIIEDIDTTLELDIRKKHWSDYQHLYAQDIPVLPLYFRADSYIYSSWLKGIQPTGHQYYSSYWSEYWKREDN